MDNHPPKSIPKIFQRLSEGQPHPRTETRLATGAFLRGQEEVSLFRNVDGHFGIAVPATQDEFERIQTDRRGLTLSLIHI